MSPGTVFGVTTLRFICFTWCHLAELPLHVYPPIPHAPAGFAGGGGGSTAPHRHNCLPPWPPLPRPPCPTRHTAPHRHRPRPPTTSTHKHYSTALLAVAE
eukprot:scaffold21423_cov66-Phaeocystis_antarctica.AAC.1